MATIKVQAGYITSGLLPPWQDRLPGEGVGAFCSHSMFIADDLVPLGATGHPTLDWVAVHVAVLDVDGHETASHVFRLADLAWPLQGRDGLFGYLPE